MSNIIYYDPLDLACKSIIGAVAEGQTLQFNVFYKEIKNSETDYIRPCQKAFLRLNKDGETEALYPMETTENGWSIAISIHEIGLYFYSFYIEELGNVSCGYLEKGELTEGVNSFLLTVFSKDYQTPAWFKGGVMYQIFPDRFYKLGCMPDIIDRVRRKDWGGEPTYKPNEFGKVLNNDFFGGNLQGIISKLPYLKNLGITVIYLNPIFEAASNHRYDTADYMNIDPFLGNEEDFKQLVDAAEKHGIRLILDGVFNHTGDNSVYFNKYGKYPSIGAYQSQESPYYNWYSFQDFPNKYHSWWGIDILPEVNENSAEYQSFIFDEGGVLKKWLSFGIGGYRLDVADELPDFFLKKLRKSVKESNPNAIIIGEVWEDASNKIAYSKRREYLQGYELDSVMNYPLKEGIIQYMQTGNAENLWHIVRVLINHYPKQTLDCLMNILGTHDTSRILTVLGGIYCNNKDEMAKKEAYLSEKAKVEAINKLKMAAILQYTLPGVPCLYYGDENGAEGHIDPFCRRCFDWEHLNEDLIAFYSKLGELRKIYQEIFKDGDFEAITISKGLFFFKRTKDKNHIYIYTNNSSKSHLIDFPNTFKNCLTNEIIQGEYIITPNSFGIFTKISED